jgi:hypothetical protein
MRRSGAATGLRILGNSYPQSSVGIRAVIDGERSASPS